MRTHGRPLGTTTRVRMRWSSDAGQLPALGDVTIETGTERAYLVVGVEEHRDSPAVWWLTLERIGMAAMRERRTGGAPFWFHDRDR